MSHLLEIRDLKVTFGGLDALSGLNFHVDEGEIVSVIGPNGAGKTTLLDCLTGVEPANEGTITFAGQSLIGLKPHQVVKRGIARTFQVVQPFPTPYRQGQRRHGGSVRIHEGAQRRTSGSDRRGREARVRRAYQ